ncbi:proteinase inhibitor I78 [Diaphorobacter sp. HDW4A]|uniref:I78 family peptidase inhibitor n=1 Tax=Diaphorobacter sp. HDW4A TaxID=2714924 RepID=UPI00140D840C|nr:I78 family peptidase inhibitor [Diaphorobacter sp. HDW4A]QIL81341.1 proteinase inhibitor I78 [Diaphorobacter sp. HDW4A]
MRALSSGLLSLCVALLLAGCQTVSPQGPGSSKPSAPPPPPEPIGKTTAPPGNICNAPPAQWAVGKMPTPSVTENARVRAGARMARVLRPGQMVTKEFDQQRLNLELDDSGKIIAARCG